MSRDIFNCPILYLTKVDVKYMNTLAFSKDFAHTFRDFWARKSLHIFIKFIPLVEKRHLENYAKIVEMISMILHSRPAT